MVVGVRSVANLVAEAARPAGSAGYRPAILAELDRRRYLVLCALLFVVVLSLTLNGTWSGDFWEHAAAVRELARAPFDPSHPLFALEEPHLDFAPYSIALGLFSRATGIGAVSTLEIAGMVNLVLFLIGLRLFVKLFSERREAPFYALLFLLLLYGWAPWSVSGLFHLNSLGVFSYPSTFAITIAFFALTLFARWLRDGWSAWWLVAVTLMATAAVLAHPVSAAFVYAVMIALVLESRRALAPSVLVPAGLTISISVGLALAWPYFSLVDLFTHEVGAYDVRNEFIYDGALTRLRVLPVLLAIPLVVDRLRRDRRDPLSLLVVFFGLLYVYGAVSQHANWGRTISFEFIVVFALLGDLASEVESRARAGALGRQLRVGLAAAAALLLVLELVNFRTGIKQAVPGATVEKDPGTLRFPAYEPIFSGVDRDAVTLAPLRAGRGIPVYGSKVVADNGAEAFVEDHPQRQDDVRRFFQPEQTQREREAIVKRYDARFVFIDRQQFPGGSLPLAPLLRLGSVERSDNGFVLIRLRR